MTRRIRRLVIALCFVGAAPAHAIVAVLPLPSTGVDAAGNVLPGGSPDPHYSVIGPGVPGGAAAVVYSSQNVFPGWVPDDPHSAWIGFSDNSDTSPHGTYAYELRFNLTGYDPASANLSGDWAADQSGSIMLNGADTGVSLPDGNWNIATDPNLTPFSISSGFKAGANLLDFVVPEPDGFDGLRVRGLTLTVKPPAFLPADFNDNGKVDFADLLILAQHYGTKTGAVHATGDANGDGAVNFDDVLILAQEYGQTGISPDASPVPEPAAVAALVVTGGFMGRRRRAAPR